MLVTGTHLAKVLGLSPQRITQLRLENKITFKSKKRKLYNLEQSILDYDRNSCAGHCLRHAADKLDGWHPPKRVKNENQT